MDYSQPPSRPNENRFQLNQNSSSRSSSDQRRLAADSSVAYQGEREGRRGTAASDFRDSYPSGYSGNIDEPEMDGYGGKDNYSPYGHEGYSTSHIPLTSGAGMGQYDEEERKGSYYDGDHDLPEQHSYPPVDTKIDAALPFMSTPLASLSKFNWRRLFYDSSPLEDKIERYESNIGVQKYPIACYILSVIMTCVLIWELTQMKSQTGSLIATTPVFNPMIGPSGASLISSGARFVGCIKFIPGISDLSWACLNASNSAVVSAADVSCTMSDICQFGGFPTASPNQSFRFILPIFLHAGVVHLLLNVLVQLMLSAAIERQMGTPRFLLLYFPAGFFGFVLGANFSLPGQPSVGASGAIFGTEAALLVDLIAHWDIVTRPGRKLSFLSVEIIVGLALGLVPGIDNFAHIGGFSVGLLCSILLLPIIHQTRRHRLVFIALRCIALPVIIILFVVLLRNFYKPGDPSLACSWCRYLSCWPSAANNRCQGTGLGSTTSSTGSYSFTSIISFVLSSIFLL